MNDATLRFVVAMICVTFLETLFILMSGTDGAVLGVTIAALAGLGGYELAKRTSATNNG